jgi:ribose 5-phosphate isomerase A
VSAQDEQFKQAAALAAVRAEVRSGMILGLGTGSTARYVIEECGRLLRDEGYVLSGVPTSEATARLARDHGMPLRDLAVEPDLDLDGADEIDPQHDLIKGRGGAITREKCVAIASRRLVIVADASKLVQRLRRPVPIEVLPFALPLVLRLIAEQLPGSEPVQRLAAGAPLLSDNGNALLDLALPEHVTPAAAAATLAAMPGLIEHGFFLGMRPTVYLAGADGVRQLP